MAERSTDWLKQAKRDLEAARKMAQGALYEWACFASQQAAEKAIKAVFQKMGGLELGASGNSGPSRKPDKFLRKYMTAGATPPAFPLASTFLFSRCMQLW